MFSYAPYTYFCKTGYTPQGTIYLLHNVSTCHIRHGHFMTTQRHSDDIHKYAQEKKLFEPFCVIPANCSFWPGPSNSNVFDLVDETVGVWYNINSIRHSQYYELYQVDFDIFGHVTSSAAVIELPIPNTDTHTHSQLFCLWK